MPSCAVRYCNNYYTKIRKEHGVSYHKFPTIKVLREQWVSSLRIQRCEPNWMPNKYTSVCSDHFKPDNLYTSAKGIRLLKKTAVPVLQIMPPYSKKINKYTVEIQTDLENAVDNIKVEKPTQKIQEDNLNVPRQTQSGPCCKKPLICDESTQTPEHFVNSLPHVKKLRQQLYRSLMKQRNTVKKYKGLQSILAVKEKSDKLTIVTDSKKRKLLRPVTVTESQSFGEDNLEHVSSIVIKPESNESPTGKNEDPLGDNWPSTKTIKLEEDTTKNRDTTRNDCQKLSIDFPENRKFEDYFNKWQKELVLYSKAN